MSVGLASSPSLARSHFLSLATFRFRKFCVNQTFDETRQIYAVGRNRDMISMMMGLEVGSWNRGTPWGSWEREDRERGTRQSIWMLPQYPHGPYASPYHMLRVHRVLPARSTTVSLDLRLRLAD